MLLTTGTRVMLEDPDYGSWHGQVVVCLCKRHTWQPQVGDGGPGTECGHTRCGYPRPASACPWPLHIRWDNDDESHQGPEQLTPTAPDQSANRKEPN
ncbi:hypothetical protein [Streptomyces sp. NPDC017260]|uniref:hypothetical protein n=1 Tax=unclassified Streptomyces TaxID=2593676 RepID=UPI00379ED544